MITLPCLLVVLSYVQANPLPAGAQEAMPQAGAAGAPNRPAPGTYKVGLFAVQKTLENAAETQNIRFDQALTQQLADCLTHEGGAQVTLLPWPTVSAFGGAEAQPISYQQMLAIGRQAGVDTILVVSVTRFEMLERKLTLPALGTFSETTGQARLEGALLDVNRGQVLGECIGDGKETRRGYNGPTLGQLGSLLNGGNLAETVPGRAAQKALSALVKQFTALNARAPRAEAVPLRDNAPHGAGFTRAQYQFDVEHGHDQWGVVDVTNRDTKPHRFVLMPGSVPKDIVVGFVGQGSVDGVFELAPGESKAVRFVATTPNAQAPTYRFPLYLYDMDSAPTATTLPDRPYDTAEAVMNVRNGQFHIKIKQVRENPATLARVYSLTNEGPEITDLSVRFHSAVGNAVLLPAIENGKLGSGESIEVTVEPLLSTAFEPFDGTLEVTGASQSMESPMRFAIPNGKKVFTVLMGSSETNTCTTHYCTNGGGGSSGAFPSQQPQCDYKPSPDFSVGEGIKDEHADGLAQKPHLSGMNADALKDLKSLQEHYKVTITSAYRSKEYQDHLVAVWNAVKELADKPGCSAEYEAAKAEKAEHALGHAPALTSDHSAGKAIDAYITTLQGEALTDDDLKTIKETYGWSRGKPHSGTNADNYHWSYSAPTKPEQTPPPPPGPTILSHLDGDSKEGAQAPVAHTGRTVEEICAEDWLPEGEAQPQPKRRMAYLTARFSVAHSYSVYSPHDTLVFVNGIQVGKIDHQVPEGIFVFPVEPSILHYRSEGNPGQLNMISTKVVGLNPGHHVIANEFKIIAPLSNSPKTVIAGSAQEAEKIVYGLPNINHDVPDIGVFANHIGSLPQKLAPGQKLLIRLLVKNVGERPSAGAVLSVYNHDPSAPARGQRQDAIGDMVDRLIHNKGAHNTKLTQDAVVPPLQPGEEQEIPVEIVYTPQLTRLYFVALPGGADFDAANNILSLTLNAPDGRSPLMGTDYPDFAAAPILARLLRLPDIGEIKSILVRKLEGEMDRVPYLKDILGKVTKF